MASHVLVDDPRDCDECGQPLELPRDPGRRLHPACADARQDARNKVICEQQRRTEPRAVTLPPRLKRGEELLPVDIDEPRPKTRADCLEGGINAERPCPWAGCKYHLYTDVNEESGGLKFNFPDKEVDELDETCALDVADAGGVTLNEVGELLNLTRERVRQVEVRALLKMKQAVKQAVKR